VKSCIIFSIYVKGGLYINNLEQLFDAAEQGDAQTQYSLSLMYIQGQGVPLDLNMAMKWLDKAAKQGHEEAQYLLNKLITSLKYNGQEPGDIAEELRVNAEDGDAEAQNSLGLMYLIGEGVPQDYNIALRWFLKGGTTRMRPRRRSIRSG
jgi:hypothetical protein